MKKFLNCLCLLLLISCKSKVLTPVARSVLICGWQANISNNEAYVEVQNIENIKASDIKVVFSEGVGKQDVRMNPRLVLLKPEEKTYFDIENIEGASHLFKIKVCVQLKAKEEVLHNGDLRIWVATHSNDRKEAEEAMPNGEHLNDYVFEAPYNLEEQDISHIWVLYKKEPDSTLKSNSLVFHGKADGNEPLPIYESFPSQGKSLDVPLYIETSEGPKVYNLIIKTHIAPEAENANIKRVSFNNKPGIIDGANIRCDDVFNIGSKVNVEVETEINGSTCVINGGEEVVIEDTGAFFAIVVRPSNKAAASKTYKVNLDAPANRAIKKVFYLNHSVEESPFVNNLLDAGKIIEDEKERFINIPLYNAAQNLALHFKHNSNSEIANVSMLKKGVWSMMDGYSSSKTILTLREGYLPLPPSLSNNIKLKVMFKNGTYDSITIRFVKAKTLQPITLLALYLNDVEIKEEDITNYFNKSYPVFEAKGDEIYVDIVSKEALHATIDGISYKSIYSGFLSYGLSIPIPMPSFGNSKKIDLEIECDYARSCTFSVNLKRLAGAVSLILYPSINGHLVGTDLLQSFSDGSSPLVKIAGDIMQFSIDTRKDAIKSILINSKNMNKEELNDKVTGQKFYRWSFAIKDLKISDVVDVEVLAEPFNSDVYLPLKWKFKVKRER